KVGMDLERRRILFGREPHKHPTNSQVLFIDDEVLCVQIAFGKAMILVLVDVNHFCRRRLRTIENDAAFHITPGGAAGHRAVSENNGQDDKRAATSQKLLHYFPPGCGAEGW